MFPSGVAESAMSAPGRKGAHSGNVHAPGRPVRQAGQFQRPQRANSTCEHTHEAYCTVTLSAGAYAWRHCAYWSPCSHAAIHGMARACARRAPLRPEHARDRRGSQASWSAVRSTRFAPSAAATRSATPPVLPRAATTKMAGRAILQRASSAAHAADKTCCEARHVAGRCHW